MTINLIELCDIQTHGKLVFQKDDWDGKTWVSSGHGYKEFDYISCPKVYVDIIPDKEWDGTNGFYWAYQHIDEIKEDYKNHGYTFKEFRRNTVDFMDPENFIKLFELKIPPTKEGYRTISELVIKRYGYVSDRESFLFGVQYFLDGNFGEDIKKAIREEAWIERSMA